MDSPDKALTDILGNWKSWIPWRSESANVSRAFWMPDQSCRVCYDCDAQFTLINRRHHCRLCGRVFCAKCTANSILAPPGNPRTPREDRERIRVCNYCYKQWNQGVAAPDHEIRVLNQDICSSPSAASLSSTRSSGTADSSCITLASVPYSLEACQQAQQQSGLSPQHSPVILTDRDQQGELAPGRGTEILSSIGDIPQNYSMNRSVCKDDYDGVYKSDSEASHSPQVTSYYGPAESEEIGNEDGSHNVQLDGENINIRSLSSSPLQESFYSHGLEGIPDLDRKEDANFIYGEDQGHSSLEYTEDVESEPVDFENNGLLWIPPEPEDEEDERETLFDDDDEEHDAGEWGYLRASSSFESGEYRSKDRSTEEHKNAMKNVVDGHFRALVAQLLQVENLPLGEISDKESWLEIITSLSWEAATLLKPDMSRGGEMDPGGYVKVKCIASGHRCSSMVVKGVVCKKNVAHRRMTSKIEKSRLLILGGALEYQRVSNHLSSFDTLLQQEIDHLKMAVAKIDAHRPDVLLVEKSVSRFAQEYLLAKDISLVLNIKRPLLERIARCTGAQIVPSIDQLSSPKLGYCEIFHVERFMEDLRTSGQRGKRSVKTLMFFEGCPKPLGCTILLRGADMDELKKAKRVVQYGVFAAYHLALETSFLADERASLPELPLNSPITVAIPVKSSVVERSISMVPDFSLPAYQGQQPSLPNDEPQRSKSFPTSDLILACNSTPPCVENGPSSQPSQPTSSATNSAAIVASDSMSWPIGSESYGDVSSPYHTLKERNALGTRGENLEESTSGNNGYQKHQELGSLELLGNFKFSIDAEDDHNSAASSQPIGLEPLNMQQNNQNHQEELGTGKDDFATASSAHQSILVSLSSRCILKGSVCERSHLFRIKYYGTFDKPLGRFLRDRLFNQTYRCDSCDMPAEAHVYCYTHRQGTLTISVKKLSEILLPGEREGKIWMWHRCLRCPRNNGFPPATRRVVMSDAAWGLSFGKFLELSFSNHIAASRVASCGHSLHRDCLRFYGYGRMIACFRYASTDVHSVYLPPSKLDFNYENQEWIQKEKDEVVNQAELLFSEVLNTLRQIAEKVSAAGTISSMRKMELRRQIAGLEAVLQNEKAKVEESLHKTMNGEGKQGQVTVDILEINYLRKKLLIQAYVWDQHLLHAAASLDKSNSAGSLITESEEKFSVDGEKLSEISTTSKSVDEGTYNGKELGTSPAQPETQIQELGDSDSEKGEEDLCNTSINSPSEPLESKVTVHAAPADGQFSRMVNLSDTLEAAWTGENGSVVGITKDNSHSLSNSTVENSSSIDINACYDRGEHPNVDRGTHAVSQLLPSKALEDTEDFASQLETISSNFYYLYNEKFLSSGLKLEALGKHNPVFLSSFWELEFQGGARLFLPLGVNETVVPVYDDEPSSIIAYALMSPEYHSQLIDEAEKLRDCGDSLPSLSFSESFLQSSDDFSFDSHKSVGPSDDSLSSISGSRTSLGLDPVLYPKSLNPRIYFEEYGPHGGVKYSVTCYYAKRFEALRRICCSELDFVKSLSRCKKWGAQGGKSNVFFAKTLDDRFIIKQVTKTELESFIKFAPEYFKYLSESICTRSPTCLAKVLGIYQVTAKHLKGGKESKMDVLVMENLLFRRNVTRLYDLKGSSRSRYNSDSTGNNKVLLDQNLIEAMRTSPIFVGNKAKRLLERAVWNDTSFLASIGVMDYSLLVGVDEEKHELVIGIIDFMRQYTWDKHLETWVKATGILGGAKNSSPTVISPKEYKKRFRKAMTTYFLMVPDQWFPQSIVPSQSQSDLGDENTQDAKSDAVSVTL
ncbi:1-phosphatidylinositol-3-phosphate 5-kinase FAB1B-like [Momordica charantia]|uniref:1-phosphatidylinositol-3-phosphate 5-kinase n=1 Tax=Momordica charantia TaxID=3673 RepID=A0A6J1D8Q4_MOMCH|nr:1-phosphatidylinositol-3-phosphate 5-kinase FAB1B-like [Momordica charantia]XP_022149707.1 1-phosphatidylinositol-3-phosphate 5-kinase FAB1B-like [Momordica charantia]XP_022149719.1 1-phosphatidylinositol-3-phosphate 5-kinase FAB1B-like [Momordica charantia]